MRKNVAVKPRSPVRRSVTHNGAVVRVPGAEEQLRRSVLACLLWEDTFYENGVSIAKRIEETVSKCSPEFVSKLAIQARKEFYLRHAPLMLCVALARIGELRAEVLAEVISRADEMGEFLALYWGDGRCPIAAQVKNGLGMAFRKFDEYALAKYSRDTEIKLRDVLRLVHPRPDSKKQSLLWARVINGNLKIPDTWEVALSAGKDKGATFKG